MKPKLIHPVWVELRNISTATVQDPDFNVPAGDVTYDADPIKVKAQVCYYNYSRIEAVAAGFQKKGDGYLLVARTDAGNIKWNAKIETIDGDTVEFYVRDITPAIHYDRSKFRILVFESKDKGQS